MAEFFSSKATALCKFNEDYKNVRQGGLERRHSGANHSRTKMLLGNDRVFVPEGKDALSQFSSLFRENKAWNLRVWLDKTYVSPITCYVMIIRN